MLLLDYSIPTVGRANFMPDEWDVVKILIHGQNEKRFVLLRFVFLWIVIKNGD